MYDELFNGVNYEWQNVTDKEAIKEILELYINEYYNDADDKDTWFEGMQSLAERLGYAANMKDYKNNPDKYKGNITDISMVLRVALTSKSMTPDLYEIMKLFGKERIKKRFESALQL